MKIKTQNLIGAALDWAVSTCQNLDYWYPEYGPSEPAYSTDWAQGGPIIGRGPIGLVAQVPDSEGFCAYYVKDRAKYYFYGDTQLIAAMRCFICSRLGETVEIPEELCQQQNS